MWSPAGHAGRDHRHRQRRLKTVGACAGVRRRGRSPVDRIYATAVIASMPTGPIGVNALDAGGRGGDGRQGPWWRLVRMSGDWERWVGSQFDPQWSVFYIRA